MNRREFVPTEVWSEENGFVVQGPSDHSLEFENQEVIYRFEAGHATDMGFADYHRGAFRPFQTPSKSNLTRRKKCRWKILRT